MPNGLTADAEKRKDSTGSGNAPAAPPSPAKLKEAVRLMNGQAFRVNDIFVETLSGLCDRVESLEAEVQELRQNQKNPGRVIRVGS